MKGATDVSIAWVDIYVLGSPLSTPTSKNLHPRCSVAVEGSPRCFLRRHHEVAQVADIPLVPGVHLTARGDRAAAMEESDTVRRQLSGSGPAQGVHGCLRLPPDNGSHTARATPHATPRDEKSE